MVVVSAICFFLALVLFEALAADLTEQRQVHATERDSGLPHVAALAEPHLFGLICLRIGQRFGKVAGQMTRRLAILFVLAGCADEPGAFECTGITGSWDFHWNERTDRGTCATGDFDNVVVWSGPKDDSVDCMGSVTVSDDGCEITYTRVACDTEDGSGSLNGVVRYVGSDRLKGVLELRNDTFSCTSIYDISAERL